MKPEIADFQAFDNTLIRYNSIGSNHPGAVVVIIHGIGEHSGRYDHLARFFSGRGWAVFTYDQRGHGWSEGKRGHVKHFQDYLQDLDQMVGIAKSAYPGLPVILFGHSMGGVVAALYALDHPVGLTDLILSSPGFVSAVKVPPGKLLAAAVLSRLLPSASFSSGLAASLLSHDRQEVDRYVNDPLNHGQISSRWAVEFLKAGRECLRRAADLRMPLLIIHGQDDQIVDCRGSQEFFDKSGSKLKNLALLPGLYHECFNELAEGREQAYTALAEWLDARYPPQSARFPS